MAYRTQKKMSPDISGKSNLTSFFGRTVGQSKCAVTSVQRKENNGAHDVSPAIEESVYAQRGKGEPLPPKTRAFMEQRIGADFSEVRVHQDEKAVQLSKQLGAKAFTHGNDIYFNKGEFAPNDAEGNHLLAHELTHVVQQISGGIQKTDDDLAAELDLANQKRDYKKIVDDWYDEYEDALQTNARRARNATDRFIDFEEGGISQLNALGGATGGVISLFGGPAAVAGLCVTVLTSVAAESLSSKAAKKAAAVSKLEDKLAQAKQRLDTMKEDLDDQIDAMTSAYDHRGWLRISRRVSRYGVPEIVNENIVYRDLLLALARGGDYNISGSQWNVENRSLFGDAPWYHSTDWGSPGWTNGRDIAAALNDLAEGDPSIRKEVHIN